MGDAGVAFLEELAALLRQPDGITQHEFESAGLVDSVLALASRQGSPCGLTMLRNAMDAESFTRCVNILQSVLSTHEQLSVFTSKVGVSALSEPVKLQFQKAPSAACIEMMDPISVEPIVKAKQLEHYVRGTAACNDDVYER